LGSVITNDGRCTCEIKSRIAIAKAAFNKKVLFTRKFNLNLRQKVANRYIWSIALCGAETWTLRKVGQKYLGSFETWCWRRIEKISWTDRRRNEEVLHRVKEERNILRTIKRRKAKWIGHILSTNCFLKHVIEGMTDKRIEVMGRRGRRGRRRNQLLDDFQGNERIL
jgi:hypothetical protein